MSETTVKGRSVSIIVGQVIGLIGLAIGVRQMFYGNVDFGWPPYTEFTIGFGLILLGLAVVSQGKLSAWMVAVWGVGLLVQSAKLGNLYGSGATYGTGVVVANALAVAYVALGLYFALRKPPSIR
jgi:steroid 5-alpha reductase family enzyme